MAGRKIFLVEDKGTISEVISEMLIFHGMEDVKSAENGKNAMELFRKEGAQVVLMDILLPDMNGLDAARCMLKVDPGVKIIAMTAMIDGDTEDKCRDAGCVDLLRKPFSMSDLIDMVKLHLQP